jgi:hypothetical protein
MRGLLRLATILPLFSILMIVSSISVNSLSDAINSKSATMFNSTDRDIIDISRLNNNTRLEINLKNDNSNQSTLSAPIIAVIGIIIGTLSGIFASYFITSHQQKIKDKKESELKRRMKQYVSNELRVYRKFLDDIMSNDKTPDQHNYMIDLKNLPKLTLDLKKVANVHYYMDMTILRNYLRWGYDQINNSHTFDRPACFGENDISYVINATLKDL